MNTNIFPPCSVELLRGPIRAGDYPCVQQVSHHHIPAASGDHSNKRRLCYPPGSLFRPAALTLLTGVSPQ